MEREKLAFFNPATGAAFGEIALSTAEEAGQAVREMRQAFPEWSAKSVQERADILLKLQHVLIERRDEITATLNADCGKSRQDGLIELFLAVDMLAQFRHSAKKWLRRERVSSGLYLFKQCFVEHRPHGVTVVIAPWNYPFTLSLPPVVSALLAGNTVVLKPSEVTAATGVLIEKLFKSVPELSPFVRVVHGDGRVGAALVASHPDYIFMTGSTATGKKIMQSAAVERVYVVGSKYDEFVKLAVQQAQELKSGYSSELNASFFMGPVTDPRQVKIIDAHLQDAVDKGAKILTGGKREGLFYDPIVLTDVTHDMKIMRDETFGPIMPIVKVQSEEEAIRLANDSAYGLGASVWSRDLRHAKRVADRIEAGSVIFNDSIAQFGVPMLPFGGVKNSGFGRTHGREGLLQFTRPYSFAVGGAPVKVDVATILRENGHYELATAIMGLVFGTTLKQKWETLSQLFRKRKKNKTASEIKAEVAVTK